MKYFKDREFKCRCGKCGKGIEQMEEELLQRLEIARGFSGIPFVLNSAYRCEEHNDWVGGSPTSRHMLGQAVDIKTSTSGERFLVLSSLIRAGFTSIGIYEYFIHADISKRNLIWKQ